MDTEKRHLLIMAAAILGLIFVLIGLIIFKRVSG